jgi:heme oxygenase
MEYFDMNLQADPWQPPDMPEFPTLADSGALIGTLYVIEGATLGGKVISRHLKDSLGLGPTSGAHFFNGYGNTVTTRNNWLTFCDFADSIGTSQELQASAKLAAIHIFERIENQPDVLHGRTRQ